MEKTDDFKMKDDLAKAFEMAGQEATGPSMTGEACGERRTDRRQNVMIS